MAFGGVEPCGQTGYRRISDAIDAIFSQEPCTYNGFPDFGGKSRGNYNLSHKETSQSSADKSTFRPILGKLDLYSAKLDLYSVN